LDTSPDNVVKAYRINDACRQLGGISRSTLYRRLDDGTLKAVQFGGVKLITDESIRAALAPEGRAA